MEKRSLLDNIGMSFHPVRIRLGLRLRLRQRQRQRMCSLTGLAVRRGELWGNIGGRATNLIFLSRRLSENGYSALTAFFFFDEPNAVDNYWRCWHVSVRA